MTTKTGRGRSGADTSNQINTVSPNYAVPAVEKALDVLELLADSSNGLSITEMVSALGRSMGELYRVVIYLERRGYLIRDADSDRFALSLRLFEMAHRHPPSAKLVKQAIPVLEDLAEEIEQSAHLAVMHEDKVLVLAVGSNPRPMSHTVKVGALFPIFETSSGTVIAAFLPDEEQKELLACQPRKNLAGIRLRMSGIRKAGYERQVSLVVAGIVNLSFPVFDHSGIVGAITVPFLQQLGLRHDETAALEQTGLAAQRLSAALGGEGANFEMGAWPEKTSDTER